MIKTAYIVSIGKGLESFIYREIEEMFKRGVDITLYTTKYNPNDIFSPKKEWTVEKLNYINIFFSLLIYILTKPTKFLKLFNIARKYKTFIELIIAIDYSNKMKQSNITNIHCHFGDRKYFIGYFCKEILGLPLSLTVHAHELFANPNEDFFKYSVHHADKIVCISSKNKDILINNFNVNSNKIEVIRLSIDLDNFSRKLKIKVLTVARYTERKGFNELFQSIKELNRDDIEFITIGFGDIDLGKMAKDLGIEEKVTIFGKMDAKQLKYFYNTCDIFCLPSKSTKDEGAEGIPVVLMEAMASEMIIVTTPNGSISELVDNILVEEDSVNDLVRGLNLAIEQLEDRNNIGSNNRKKVISEYSERNIDTLKRYLYE